MDPIRSGLMVWRQQRDKHKSFRSRKVSCMSGMMPVGSKPSLLSVIALGGRSNSLRYVR
jgi:hypothetical protein